MLRRRMLIMLGTTLVIVVALGSYKGYSIYQQMQKLAAPLKPVYVSAVEAGSQPWQSRLTTVGSLTAFQGVELTSETRGQVKQVFFDSGQQVERGQPLLQLKNSVEKAALATAEASLGLARIEFKRAQDLLKRQVLAKSEFDRLAAELAKSDAVVAQLKAVLAKKEIRAPFSGTIGIRKVDVGSQLSYGTPFATLQNLDKLYLDFFLPEQNLPLLKVGQSVLTTVSAYPDEVFQAQISAISPKVEPNTRNVQIRASLDNPGGRLLPGMFAGLAVLYGLQEDAVVIPETAVTFTLYGNTVYVVGPKLDDGGKALLDEDGQPQLIAQRRNVQTGERRDALVHMRSGLKAGEKVVTNGQLKLDDGTLIKLVADPAQTKAAAQ
jgi:membrane fusion protein (multidrug efflux system)